MAAAKTLRTAAEKHRRQAAERSRERTKAAAECGPLPKIKNAARKRRCKSDLAKFLAEYIFARNPDAKPLGDDQLAMVRSIESCVLHGGRALHRQPRGFIKTTLAEAAAIWAVVYGHRKFVPVFAATGPEADSIIESIKMELRENDLLYEDFPEVCHPIRHLNGTAHRANSQTFKGRPTYSEWSADTIVLPTLPKSAASGAVLTARGITAASRGMRHKCPNGEVRRPDFAIIDDFQTDESAGSITQTRSLLNVIRKAIGRAGGHARGIAMVVNATPIMPGDGVDQMSDAKKFPSFRVQRSRMLKRFPDAMNLWLDDYAALRTTFDRSDPASQAKAKAAALELYIAKRPEMDAGAIVAWEHCYSTADGEISAIQHAMNIIIDEGWDVFNSECNDTPPVEEKKALQLTPEAVANKLSGVPRGRVPRECEYVTAFIDVNKDFLFWCCSAWSEDFGGGPVDYGPWPEQPRPYFTKSAVPVTLAEKYPGLVEDAFLLKALDDLAAILIGRRMLREDGREMRIGKILVDVRWGEKNKLLKTWCARHPEHGRIIHAAQGIGFSATSTPIGEFRPDGARTGDHWRLGPVKNGDIWVSADVNYWKTVAASRLLVAKGTPGSWQLFGDNPTVHAMFADYCCNEEPIEVTAKGRTVTEWRLLPGRNDNEPWDCLVGSAVAGSLAGAAIPGTRKVAALPGSRGVPLAQMWGKR
jgi:hypothetical protein